LDDFDARIVILANAGIQKLNKPPIPLNRNHLASFGKKFLRENAETRTNFKNHRTWMAWRMLNNRV